MSHRHKSRKGRSSDCDCALRVLRVRPPGGILRIIVLASDVRWRRFNFPLVRVCFRTDCDGKPIRGLLTALARFARDRHAALPYCALHSTNC